MPVSARIRLYAVSLITFLVLDFVWLGAVAAAVYERYLGPIMRPDVQWAAAIAFYLLYVAGVMFFATEPAIGRDSWRAAAGRGAFLGLVAYATFDLTALATLQGFPIEIVFVDLVWGAVLTATVATVGYWSARHAATG